MFLPNVTLNELMKLFNGGKAPPSFDLIKEPVKVKEQNQGSEVMPEALAEKPREIRSTKELLAEVVKKPTEYIELKALPHFYRKFLQPAHMLNTE